MTQTIEMNKMGLAPMNDFEMQEVEGGTNWWAVAGLVLGVAACIVTAGAATPAVIGMGDALAGMAFASSAIGVDK